jgi:hypothetical protein
MKNLKIITICIRPFRRHSIAEIKLSKHPGLLVQGYPSQVVLGILGSFATSHSAVDLMYPVLQ